MDKILETYSLPRLSQEEIDKLITRIEIASIIIKTRTENSLLTELQDWMASLRNSIKHTKKSLHLSFSKYSTSHSRIPNLTKTPPKKKKKRNYRPVSLNIEAKILSNILAKQIQQHREVSYTIIKWDSLQGHTHNGLLFSHKKNGILPADYLEITILNEIKPRQITITHIWNLKK